MNIKIIKNDRELESAIAELTAMMEKNPVPDEKASDAMKLLALVIKDYEDKHYPIPPPTPIEAIRFRMEQMGLTVKDLEPCIGRTNRVYEVLSGKRKLTINMIRKLSASLKISSDILIGAA